MKVNIVNSIESFYALESDWNNLAEKNELKDYYISFSWIKSYIESTKKKPKDLYIICVTLEGALVAIVPLSITSSKGRVFDLKTLQFIGNVYTPFWSAIYEKSKLDEIVKAIVEHLFNTGENDWELMKINEVSEKDPFIIAFDELLKRRGAKTYFSGMESNVQVILSGYDTAEDYFKGLKKNFRQNIRTSINRFNKDGNFKILIPHENQNGLDQAMDDYYEVYNASWKDSEGDSGFHRKLAHITKREGKLRFFQLYLKLDDTDGEPDSRQYTAWDSEINGEEETPSDDYVPIASIYYVLHKGCAYCLKMSYKLGYNKYGAGTVLLWYSIKYMLERDEINLIDFQKGEDAYKLQWGEVRGCRRLYSVYNANSLRARIEHYVKYKAIAGLKALINKAPPKNK